MCIESPPWEYDGREWSGGRGMDTYNIALFLVPISTGRERESYVETGTAVALSVAFLHFSHPVSPVRSGNTAGFGSLRARKSPCLY